MTFGCWCADGNDVGQPSQRGRVRLRGIILTFMKRSRPSRSDIIFITGTDTGVGKTVLTALLLQQMRRSGLHALAMKPFCTGTREDVEILRAIQGDELPERLINPYFYAEPVAPWLAAKNSGKTVRLTNVINRINEAKRCCQMLLVEGAGGLLSPLGSRFTALDLIAELDCEVVVVAPNRLGCINQIGLVTHALASAGLPAPCVILMEQQLPDDSARSNQEALRRWNPQIPLITVRFLRDLELNFEPLKGAPKTHAKDFSKKLLHCPKMLVELMQFFGAAVSETVRKKPKIKLTAGR